MNIKTLADCFSTLKIYNLTARLTLLALLIALSCVSQSVFAQPESDDAALRRMRLERISSRTQIETTEQFSVADSSSSQTTQNLTALTPSAEADIDTTFNVSVSEGPGYVEDMVVQPDGKIIVVGSFVAANGATRNHIARLNADASLDASFNPGAGANASIEVIALQSDGKILIGGNFTNFNGVALNRLARLNSDGSLDITFNIGTGVPSVIETIAIQADGKVIIGGSFSFYNGTPRGRIARLNTDGSLDSNFNASLNGIVNSIVIQPDGKILAGGAFSGRIVRINPDGTNDSSFVSGAAAPITAIELLTSGKILIGYDFTSANTAAARLNVNGSLDVAFSPLNGNSIGVRGALLSQPDGKVLIGGGFIDANGNETGAGVVRFNADGIPDTTFPTINTNFGMPMVLKPSVNGKIFLGGDFTTYNGIDRLHIAQFNQNGSLDVNFNALISTPGIVYEVLTQPDGKILVGGDFEFINGVRRNYLARLNSNGTLDTSFNIGTGANSLVRAFALQPDGKILIGGYFNTLNGVQSDAIVRLNQDGSRDDSFVISDVNPYFVDDIKIQPDNKIIVGGWIFSTTQMETGITRLNPDGSRDASFSDISSLIDFADIYNISIQPDGKIIFSGQIGFTNGNRSLARLNSNGTFDTTFTPAGNPGLIGYTSAIQPDGKILWGGSISRLNSNGTFDLTFNQGQPTTNNYVRDILLQSNDKILIGGSFTAYNNTPINRVARLNADGTPDMAFNVGAGANDFVDTIAAQNDGKLLVGGRFTTFNGQLRRGLVRLQGSAVNRKTPFDFDGDGRADIGVVRQNNWLVQRSSQGFFGVQFGNPTDKLVPADFDGDGKTDVAVFRDGFWYWLNSSSGSFNSVPFGAGGDIPIPADYTGDGRAELAVYRSGFWYTFNLANNQFQSVQFGNSTDKPVPADFDGDGKTDFAVYRDGNWFYLQSTDNSFRAVQFGLTTDKPVVGDYDGDGKADPTVFRDGFWYVLASTQGFFSLQFGVATDKPVPADYDGDGKIDAAVFRDGNWYLLRSAQGFAAVPFGVSSDVPIPSTYLPL